MLFYIGVRKLDKAAKLYVQIHKVCVQNMSSMSRINYCIKSSGAHYEQPCINRRKAVYKQGNSRTVNAWLCNFQYARIGATELLPS